MVGLDYIGYWEFAVYYGMEYVCVITFIVRHFGLN
ncbi:Uncharacterised protein [Klebsiella michiganensis]|nr:Uncharacterised protein [Klebsiella michiganensis]